MSNSMTDVLERLLAAIPSEYDTSAGTVMSDIVTAAAYEFEGAYADIDLIFDRYMIATATGTDLDNKLAEFAFARKAASYATGTIIISGYSGAEIPEGSKVSTGSVNFEITESGTIGDDGVLSLPIRCCTVGVIGNVNSGAINLFPVTLSNIISVYNTAPTSGGEDSESDDDYRNRFFAYIQHPHTAGNKYDYENWAMSVSGIGKAKCIPTWDGANTVKVILWSNDMGAVNNSIVDTVAAYINDKKPIGVEVTVASVIPVLINITCSATFEENINVNTVKTNIQNRLSEYLHKGAIYSKIAAIIAGTNGVVDCTNIKVNNGTANITITDEQTAVLGGITYE